jgi:flagellar hook assembly protein FlgD
LAKHPAPFHPVAAQPGQEGQELSVVVNAPQKSLVTVRILDAGGKEVRVLYTGFVDSGRWAFKWDGLLENGAPANPGQYRIDVQSGSAHLSKDIQIKVKPASN